VSRLFTRFARLFGNIRSANASVPEACFLGDLTETEARSAQFSDLLGRNESAWTSHGAPGYLWHTYLTRDCTPPLFENWQNCGNGQFADHLRLAACGGRGPNRRYSPRKI